MYVERYGLKKNTNDKYPKNYCAIALSILGKIFIRVILNRVENHIEKEDEGIPIWLQTWSRQSNLQSPANHAESKGYKDRFTFQLQGCFNSV